VLLAELLQAGRAHLLAGLDQHLQVEAELAARAQHRFERGKIDRVLALVVGRATTVDAIAFLPQRPRPALASRIGKGPRGHAHAGERLRHLGFEIALELCLPLGVLALGRDRHAPGEVGMEGAAVEVLLSGGDSGLSCHSDNYLRQPEPVIRYSARALRGAAVTTLIGGSK